MKKLDIFSRFENSLYWVWIVLSIFVFPAILIHLINKLYLESLDWFIRYPILFICWIVGFLICFAIGMAIGATLEDIFNKIRKILGKKPLMKIINDQKQEQFEHEIQAEERIKERFMNQSGDEKLYWLWARQNMYFEALTREIKNLKLLIFVLFIILLAIKFLG